MKPVRTLVLLLAAAGAAVAQSGEFLSTPRLGWTVGEDGRELRAILGVPGAGRVSEAVALPEGVTRLYLAPGQEYALGYGEESGGWQIVSLRDDSLLLPRPIDALSGAPGRVVFAPGGRAFAVTGAQDSTVQMFTVSDGVAHTAWSTAVETSARLALDPSGGLLLAAGPGGVVVHRRGAETVHLAGPPEVSGMAFRPSGESAVLADAGQRALVVLEGLAGEPVSRTIAVPVVGVPGVITWSGDGRYVWCADRESNAIARVEIATGAVERVATDVPVTQFDALPGSDHFLLSAPRGGQAAWMLLASEERASTYFVPGNPQGAQE